jgi:hypothetical protein
VCLENSGGISSLTKENAMQCILNVTDHEFDKLLQLTHSRTRWSTRDCYVQRGIANLLGRQVATEVRDYEECRMEKHDELWGFDRVEPVPELVRVR